MALRAAPRPARTIAHWLIFKPAKGFGNTTGGGTPGGVGVGMLAFVPPGVVFIVERRLARAFARVRKFGGVAPTFDGAFGAPDAFGEFVGALGEFVGALGEYVGAFGEYVGVSAFAACGFALTLTTSPLSSGRNSA